MRNFRVILSAVLSVTVLAIGEVSAQSKKLPTAPVNPPVEAMERCVVEIGKPGNVLRSGTLAPKPGGQAEYVYRYECVYIDGLSAFAKCNNGGKPEYFEPGYLDPASAPKHLAPCNNAVVLCCK